MRQSVIDGSTSFPTITPNVHLYYPRSRYNPGTISWRTQSHAADDGLSFPTEYESTRTYTRNVLANGRTFGHGGSNARPDTFLRSIGAEQSHGEFEYAKRTKSFRTYARYVKFVLVESVVYISDIVHRLKIALYMEYAGRGHYTGLSSRAGFYPGKQS